MTFPTRHQPDPKERQIKPASLLLPCVIVITILLIAFSACCRAGGEDFRRGLETDELLTLQNYTWAGVHADGTRRDLLRLSDIQQLGVPSKVEAVLGVYCSLGRWPEPNNHAIHSLFVNGTLPLFERKEIGLRLPALLAAAAFALAVTLLCWQCGWHATSVLAGAVAFWHPYVLYYSQEARGYTLMLLFVVLFLFCCRHVMRNPISILLASSLVLISVALFQNTVNMAVDWVIPCYGLLILFPGLFDPDSSAEHRQLRRRNLMIQCLCVGLAGFIFLMDRLPYVYSSSQQYGLPFGTFREFGTLLLEDLDYLFPGPSLVVFALLGSVGMALAWFEKPGRGFVALGVFAVLATLLHFAAARRFAYPRNLGYWLLPVLLGYACLGQRIIAFPQLRWQRFVLGAVVYGGTFALLAPVLETTVTDPGYQAFRARLQELTPKRESAALALLGKGLPTSIRLDFPAEWSEATIPTVPGAPVDLFLVEKLDPLPLWERRGDPSSAQPPPWPGAETVVQEGYDSVVRLRCRVEDADPRPTAANGVLLWYPSFESVAVSPALVLHFLAERRLRFHAVNTRYQAKLEVFERLACVVSGGTSPAEVQRIWNTYVDARRRFGGQVVFLVPRGPP